MDMVFRDHWVPEHSRRNSWGCLRQDGVQGGAVASRTPTLVQPLHDAVLLLGEMGQPLDVRC